MGNILYQVIGSIIVLYLKIANTIKELFEKKKQPSYYSNDILLRDEGNQAGIY